MPYIEQRMRGTVECQTFIPSNAGQLNYKVTKIIHQYIQKNGLSYCNINEAIGVLECAKLELYRMIAVPYENKKRAENGHISNLDESIV